MARWRELTSAATRAVTVTEAKAAIRVTDTQSIATKANRSTGTGNSQLLIVAKIGGSIGNQYATRIVVSGNNTALSVSFANNLLTITSATNGGGSATSTVNDIIAAIYANADAAAIFDATSGSGNGTGVIVAATQSNLTAGVDGGDEDAYVGFLIDAATAVVEARTSRCLIQRTIREFWDDWPGCDEIELSIMPVQSVQAVNYYDVYDAQGSFTNYLLDAEDDKIPARIVKKFGYSFPLVSIERPNAVSVDYTVGYGPAATDIPANIKQCILFLVGHWYNNREPVLNGTAALSNKIPYTFSVVLNSFRLVKVV